MPRRTAPLETRRAHGRSPGRDSGGRPLPAPANVVQLRGIEGQAPGVPDSLVEDGPGARRWVRIWREASWLSPTVDIDVVTRLCEYEDLLLAMKAALEDQGFYVEGSQGQPRPNPLLAQIRATNAQLLALEGDCGLTPSSRGKLGVGEVKPGATSQLAAVLAAHAQHRAKARGAS